MSDIYSYKKEIVSVLRYLLNTAKEVYNDAEESLPETRYYTVGTIGNTVHDCSKVVASFVQSYPGSIGSQAFDAVTCDHDQWTYVFSLEIVRGCYPNIVQEGKSSKARLPTAEEYMNDAEIRATDAYLLKHVAEKAAMALGSNYLADITSTQASGGFSSMILNFYVENTYLSGEYGELS